MGQILIDDINFRSNDNDRIKNFDFGREIKLIPKLDAIEIQFDESGRKDKIDGP